MGGGRKTGTEESGGEPTGSETNGKRKAFAAGIEGGPRMEAGPPILGGHH